VSRFWRPSGAVRLSGRCSLAAGGAVTAGTVSARTVSVRTVSVRTVSAGTVSAGAVAAGVVAAAALAACSSATVPVSHSDSFGPHTASLTADGSTRATLNVLSGTTTLTIGVAHFGPGGSLLRVTTPPGYQAAQLLVPHADGTAGPGQDAQVDLTASNAPAVSVTLNADVSWQLNLGGGASQTTVDLRGGHVSGIAFTAGVSSISLALPRPSGSVTVQLAGGASNFLLSLPLGVPARVTAGGGAGDVSLLGQDHTGVAGGSAFTTPGWTPGVTGYDIDATSGASHIAVTAQASQGPATPAPGS
jgi:hypothetical protein